MPVTGNSGPRPGNRARDTLANNASKNLYPNGYQAPISSQSAVSYGNQLAEARYGYLQQLAMLKAQRAQVGASARLGRADARSAAVSGMAGQVSSSIERGVSGSSADLAGRAGVIADRQRSLAEVEQARAQGRLDIGYQALGARNQYGMQVAGIQNAMAQEQMANTIMAFQNDMFDARRQDYRAIMAAIRNQKTGEQPRQRTGLGAGMHTNTWGQSGLSQGNEAWLRANFHTLPPALQAQLVDDYRAIDPTPGIAPGR